MQTHEVTVTVEALREDADLNWNDREDSPVGNHPFFVDANDPEVAIKRALDQFHATVPVKVLEDFDIDARIAEESSAAASLLPPMPEGEGTGSQNRK